MFPLTLIGESSFETLDSLFSQLEGIDDKGVLLFPAQYPIYILLVLLLLIIDFVVGANKE